MDLSFSLSHHKHRDSKAPNSCKKGGFILFCVATALALLFCLTFSVSSPPPPGVDFGTRRLLLSPTPPPLHACANYGFNNDKVYESCEDLAVLKSSVHWNYDKASARVEVAYRRSGISGNSGRQWIAWGINPTSQGMLGAQALVAHQRTDGSMAAYTSPITSYGTQLKQGNLSFPVSQLSAAMISSDMIIFATFDLSTNANATSTLNHVWQEGPLNSQNTPSIHAMSASNLRSFGTLDLLLIDGKTAPITTTAPIGGAAAAAARKLKLRQIHAFLNAISWGILMPIGVLMARYLKMFESADPAWFHLHRACQCSAFILGIAGGATGFWLGNKSSGIQYSTHRRIGMALLCLASLQVLTAVLARPKKDHKYRPFWNFYHYLLGYSIIVLSIINVFKGLDILQPARVWKNAYIAIIAALGVIAFLLETFKWGSFLWNKRSAIDHQTNGANPHVAKLVLEEV